MTEFSTFIQEKAQIAHEHTDRSTWGVFEDAAISQAAKIFQSQSDSDIEHQLKQEAAKLTFLKIITFPAFLALLVLVGFATYYFEFVGLLLSAVIGGLTYGFKVIEAKHEINSTLGLGRVLADTHFAPDLFHTTLGSYFARAYIEFVAKHRQLYVFDYAVAAGLARSDKQQRDRNQARFENEVALRRLANLTQIKE